MGKTFKFGERKHKNQKQRMIRYNQYTSLTNLDKPRDEKVINSTKVLSMKTTYSYNSGGICDYARDENVINEEILVESSDSRNSGDAIVDNACAENVINLDEEVLMEWSQWSRSATGIIVDDARDENVINLKEEVLVESSDSRNSGDAIVYNARAANVINLDEEVLMEWSRSSRGIIVDNARDENVLNLNEEVLMESSDSRNSEDNIADNARDVINLSNEVLMESSGNLEESNNESLEPSRTQIFENTNGSEGSDQAIQIEGNRIVHVDYFMEQLRRILNHGEGNCPFDNLEIRKEIRNGFHSKIVYHCTSCNEMFRIQTSKDEKTTDTLCLNSTAVLGANLIGIGYTQLQQFASVMDIPTMCNDKFKKLNDEIGEYWEETAEEIMRNAAEEEALAAIARGDVDGIDGIPYITVIVDATWSKRSYNKNFTGVSAIVGAYTGKVLWIGVRNKYCVTCVRSANKNQQPPPHLCTKNYSGPSYDMECDAILQGFQTSIELYNLRYMKVIGDGDSSTYLKILEHKPYQDRHVEKIECTNHLQRNLRTKIEVSVKGCPRGLKDHVTDNLERIRKDICCAIQYRKKQNTNEDEKVSLLKSDLANVLHHVFGDHANCPTYIKTFCKEGEDYIPALQQSAVFDNMSKAVRELIYCSKDLILGETNNPAEHYNSIVAKFVGGKRINFSLSKAYTFKAYAAAVQFNTNTPLSALYKKKFNSNPPVVGRKIEIKRLQKSQREKNRRRQMKANKIHRIPFCRVKQSGYGYGLGCQKPDLSAEDFETEARIVTEKLKKNQEDRISIEKNTYQKHKSSLWQQARENLILSKDFGAICKARVFEVHVKNVIRGKFAETKAMKHNKESQQIAQQQMAAENNISIRECGLFIDTQHMCLAASPSGIVDGSDSIVEIQCPLVITNKDPNDPDVLAKLDFMEVKNNQVVGLKKNHSFFFDIQGQLHICNKSICLFGIWTSTRHKMYIEQIEKDDNFFDTKMKNQLLDFYDNWLFPELVNPRLSRNMSIRVPDAV